MKRRKNTDLRSGPLSVVQALLRILLFAGTAQTVDGAHILRSTDASRSTTLEHKHRLQFEQERFTYTAAFAAATRFTCDDVREFDGLATRRVERRCVSMAAYSSFRAARVETRFDRGRATAIAGLCT